MRSAYAAIVLVHIPHSPLPLPAASIGDAEIASGNHRYLKSAIVAVTIDQYHTVYQQTL